MVKKTLQGHNFKEGGPIKGLSWIDGDAGYFVIGTDTATITNGDHLVWDNNGYNWGTTATDITFAVGDTMTITDATNNIVLGSGITVDGTTTDTTFVNNLSVQGTLDVPSYIGDTRIIMDESGYYYLHEYNGNNWEKKWRVGRVRLSLEWRKFKNWVKRITKNRT